MAENSDQAGSAAQADAKSPKPNRLRRWTIAGAAVAAAAGIASAIGWQGHAHAHGRGFGHHGWHNADPATMSRKLDAMVAWVLSDIDATPEQRERVATILKGAVNDLAPLRQTHLTARRESVQLMAAPTIDKARLEALRVQQMQLGDSASRRMLQAITDAAEVLNPDQRARLIGKWSERMERRRG